MRYVFAECVLDTRIYTLHRAGMVIRLRPKVFHVLQYLLEHRDHVVSKDEFWAQVWPGQFISDATLEGCITLARRAIGDSGRAQWLIQSRRGYGYRFVGTVQEYAAGPSAQATAAAAQGPPAVLVQAPVPELPAAAQLPGAPGAVDAGVVARMGVSRAHSFWKSRTCIGAMRPRKNGWQPLAHVLVRPPSSCWGPIVRAIGHPGSTYRMPRS
jgi:DNA-binding winged helix-turn-helix (wHTH) protein